MIKRVFSQELLLNEAQEFCKKKGKPGIDGMTGETFLMWLKINGEKLCSAIVSGKYEPMPICGFTVAKSNGKPRILSKLTVTDTVIQKVLLKGIYDLFDANFSENSFAFRKGRGVSNALSLYCAYGGRHKFVAKIDPVAYFDNIDHSVLESILSEKIKDRKLLGLIMRFVKAPIITEGEFSERNSGIPQGAPISSLLANIYLDRVDKEWEKLGADFIRYADDIAVFADSREEAEKYYAAVKNILENELKLEINLKESIISTPCEIRYLGYEFCYTKNGIIAEDGQSVPFYTNWKKEFTPKRHNALNIVSDGILRQKDYSLLFETENDKVPLPVKSYNALNIYSGVILDSGALKTAFDNGLIINVFSNESKLLGRFIPNAPLRNPPVVLEQLEEYNNTAQRLYLAKQFALASFHNTRLVIRYYNKQNKNQIYTNALETIDLIYSEIKNIDTYENLLLAEARGREAYYNCYDEFIDSSPFVFEKRSRKPPQNEVNALISFGNTLLYNFIATAIYKSALDIRVGYLHATNKRKESLNLDIAEIFKPLVVDRTAFTLINRRVLTKEHFLQTESGVYLNKVGEEIFIKALYDKLETTLNIKGEDINYQDLISLEIQKLTRHFRNKEKYKPYKQIR